MLEFIYVPLTVAIVAYSIYSLFELFARRRERIMLIEKLSELNQLKGTLPDITPLTTKRISLPSFSTLRIGGILLGIGAGILIGGVVSAGFNQLDLPQNFRIHQLVETVMGASVMLCAGISLVIVYAIERKEFKNKKEKSHE